VRRDRGAADEVVYIPKRIAEEAARRGLDINELVLNAVIGELKLDPSEVPRVRVERAERFLEEAKTHLEKGDPIQASEKLYKVAEECVKALAEAFNPPELEETHKRGRWTAYLLGSASRSLAKKLNEPRVEYIWAVAYDIHVWGFHEAKYDVEKIKGDVTHVEWLLNYTKKLIEEWERQRQRNA